MNEISVLFIAIGFFLMGLGTGIASTAFWIKRKINKYKNQMLIEGWE